MAKGTEYNVWLHVRAVQTRGEGDPEWEEVAERLKKKIGKGMGLYSDGEVKLELHVEFDTSDTSEI